MKKYKILTAALAAAVIGGSTAMAQLNYQNGDLILAFGKSGDNDLLVNLGSLANYQAFPASYSVDLSAAITSTFGSMTGVKWALFGVNDLNSSPLSGISQGDANTVWLSSTMATRAVPGQDTSDAFLVTPFNQIVTMMNSDLADSSLASITTPSGAVGAATVANSVQDGYSSQNISYPGQAGMLDGTWVYNIMKTGAGTEYLLQNDAYNTGNNALLEANFTLSSAGVLSVTTVPEPTTWAMVGSGMLALLAIRRRK